VGAGPAAGVIGGKFYLAGGHDFDDFPISALDVYDPATNTWTSKAPMPWAGQGWASTVIGGKLYVAGKDKSGTNRAAVYDPVANRWTPIALSSTSRNFAAGAAAGGKFLVIGGETSSNPATRKVEAYTP
jgi:N-acetylneuraminic acid mutarotase